jgi:amino acid transporter
MNKLNGKVGPLKLEFSGNFTRRDVVGFAIFFTTINVVIGAALLLWFTSLVLALLVSGPTFWGLFAIFAIVVYFIGAIVPGSK